MKVSACYIVKDEIKELLRSIDSLKDQADEIIVVATAELRPIQEALAGRAVQVFYLPWQEDFSKAKNYALKKATGDWLILLDADEYFLQGGENIKEILEKAKEQYPDFEGILAKILNFEEDNRVKDEFYQLRIVKNSPDLHYYGRIHEFLLRGEDYINKAIRLEDNILKIGHTGYISSLTKEKAQRNLRLLELEVANGRKIEELYRYFMEAYRELGDTERAIYYAKMDVARGRQNTLYAAQSHRYLLAQLANRGDFPGRRERLELASNILQEFPELPDFYGEYGGALIGMYRYGEGIAAIERAIAMASQYKGIEPSLLDEEDIRGMKATLEALQWLKQKEKDIRLSLCVITKNEEKNIVTFINKGKEFADEIIVVDTGSQDKTVELASSLGAKVYTYQWQEDFAKAKNYALGKAKGDWIAFLDADEYFSHGKSLRGYLANFAENNKILAISVPEVHIDVDKENRELGRHPAIRLFRNLPEIAYEGRIHEELNIAPENIYQASEVLELIHTGYSTNIVKEKLQRNLRLLEQELALTKTPEKYYYYLADCFFGLGKYQEAVDNALKAIVSPYQPLGQEEDMYRLALLAMEKEKYKPEDRLVVVEEGLRQLGDNSELLAFKGILLLELQEYALSYGILTKALEEKEKKPNNRGHFTQLLPRIYFALGKAGSFLHRPEAKEWLKRSLLLDPWQEEALGEYVDLEEEQLEAAAFCQELYGDENSKRELCLSLLNRQGLLTLGERLATLWGIKNPQHRLLGEAIKEGSIKRALQEILQNQHYLFIYLFSQLARGEGIKKEEQGLLSGGLGALLGALSGNGDLSEELLKEYMNILPSFIIFADSELLARYLWPVAEMPIDLKLRIADSLQHSEKWQEALSIYEAIPMESVLDNRDYWFAVGRAMFSLQEYKGARECLQRASSLGLDNRLLGEYLRWYEEIGE